MVFFTCNHCGDSVKKNQVEKHYQTKCRNISVACMDCNKDFDKLTYEKHTKCISEEVRYSAVGFQPKPSANKGEAKQEKWMDHLQTVMLRKGLTPEQSNLMDVLSNHTNIPRKKNKFQNFVKSLSPRINMRVVDQVWDLLQEQTDVNGKVKNEMPCNDENKKELKGIEEQEITEPDMNALSNKERKQLRKKAKYEAELQNIKNEPSVENMECEAQDEVKKEKKKKAKKNGSGGKPEDGNLEEVHQSEEQAQKRGKKRKVEEIGEAVSECKAKINKEVNGSCIDKTSKFNWQETIVKLLNSKSDKELPLKRLRKKVLAEYEALHGQLLEKHIAKFNKTILKIPGVIVKKEVAKLVASS